MKLYLSSYHLGDKSEELKRMVGPNKKAGIIINAIDFSSDELHRNESIQGNIDELKSLGFIPEALDLRDYFGKSDALKQKLKEFGLLWVKGGNCFVLLRAMHESGFDEILKTAAHTDAFVYGGYSAGVCVLCPTMRGIHLADDPDIIPAGYKKQTFWDGIGLIPYCIAPHYKSDHPEAASIDNVVAYYQEHNIPFKPLRDGEVIIENI